IREEVDQDANIILGATFDESLEGIIRVSVVATGIDKIEMALAGHVAERHAEPVVAAPAPRAVPQAESAMSRVAVAEPTPVLPAAVAVDEFDEEIEDDFTDALEAEIAQVNPSSLAAEPPAPRMPRVEDFPPVVRAEIESRSAEHHGEDRGPMGLLRRLTTGLSRRDEEEHPTAEIRQNMPQSPRRAAVEPNPYAPRRVAAESGARPVSQAHSVSDDDQLEIPAFLRRQAN
ncbi:cell division protein FtsZ, partial [Aurantimonas sp. LRZ36]|nr:cell division protein FtsZ [Aurantimonas marianensis]